MNSQEKSGSASAAGRGRLYVISAPSGAGKTSLVKALMEREPRSCAFPSPTPRASPGANEIHGRDYHFVSPERFRAR